VILGPDAFFSQILIWESSEKSSMLLAKIHPVMNIAKLLGRKRTTDEEEGRFGLPPEIWLQIFWYLDDVEAIAASKVCKIWRELVMDDDKAREAILLQRKLGEAALETRLQKETAARMQKRSAGCAEIAEAGNWVCTWPSCLPICLCYACCACFQCKTAPLGEFSEILDELC
jgi:hypothetical protein